MLQRAMAAFALLGGALLAGSFLVQAKVGPEERPTATVQIPVSLSNPNPTPAPIRTPAASSVPGATEPAKVQAPRPKDESEAKVLAVLDELDHYREGTMNVPREDGRMLRLLAEAIGAKNVVEIGTSNGYSGIWLSLALRTTRGHLTTFEIDRGRFEMTRSNFKRAGVDDRLTQVFGNAHQELGQLKDPIDLLFIDADKQGYLDYFTKLLPLVRPGGLILAHNMASPPPDPAFVKAITTNPQLETLFVNMDVSGLGITLKKR
jgi:caffeoyl-CoA O-methyltransferase